MLHPVELDERIRRIRVLLETLNDCYVESDQDSTHSEPGLAASKIVLCSYPNWNQDGTRRCLRGRACPVCEGRGWRRRRSGDLAWDEYAAQRVDAEKPSQVRVMTSEELEDTLAKLRRDAAARAGLIDNGEEHLWVLRKRDQDRSASYPELRRALERLRDRSPGAYDLIAVLYFTGIRPFVDARFLQAEERVLVWLATEMGSVRVPWWAQEEAAKRKHARVRELAAAGLTSAEIARAVCMKKEKVRRILSAPRATMQAAGVRV